MLDGYKTVEVLVSYYADCLSFHNKNGYTGVQAHKMALQDVKAIVSNPYSPSGEKLDAEAHKVFIEVVGKNI